MDKACYHKGQNLLPLVAVSAITRRNICHGGIGDIATTHNRYCDAP